MYESIFDKNGGHSAKSRSSTPAGLYRLKALLVGGGGIHPRNFGNFHKHQRWARRLEAQS